MIHCFFRLAVVTTLLLAVACRPADRPSGVDYGAMPAFTETGINVVVESPAGTNREVQFRPASGDFTVDRAEGEDRFIRFLPFPGNYGFIPATGTGKKQVEAGDPLAVLLLSESVPTGTVMEALPIAALRLEDQGEVTTKIIAVPLDSNLRIIDVTHFRDFFMQYDGAKRMVEEWFLYYKGLGSVQLLGWEDEHYAMEEIRRRLRSD